MPLDASPALPEAGPADLRAEVRAAELALARLLPPGADWREVTLDDPLFRAKREALRRAHALDCAARDAAAAEGPRG